MPYMVVKYKMYVLGAKAFKFQFLRYTMYTLEEKAYVISGTPISLTNSYTEPGFPPSQLPPARQFSIT